MSKPKKISPLKNVSFRKQCHYLTSKLLKLDEKIEFWVTAFLLGLFFCAYEWIRWYTEPPPLPGSATAIFLVISAISVRGIRRNYLKGKNYQLGKEGEEYIASFLYQELPDGYKVINDIPVDKLKQGVKVGEHNIDHVVVGPKGIFLIETKTLRKGKDEDNQLRHEDDEVYNGAEPLPYNPCHQADSYAKKLERLIEERIERKYSVNPVVLFPGWYVTPDSQIFNEKYFVGYLEKLERTLKEEEIKSIIKTLNNYAKEMHDKQDS